MSEYWWWDDDQHRAACAGKIGYQSGGLAWRIGVRRTERGYVSQPYRCKFCGLFHLGQPTKKRFKRRRRL